MQGEISKLRNVYGQAAKTKFEDVKPHETNTEGSLIDTNGHFIAVSWSTRGGGCCAVLDAHNPTRINRNIPLLRNHKAPVTEVRFSPFRTNLLATGSDDSTVRLWEIPQDGVQEDQNEIQKFTGHSKKVGIVNFHPTVAEMVCSSSFDNTIAVWNICNAETHFTKQFNDTIFSCDWNHNGSMIGVTTREKQVHVVDPRGEHNVVSCHGHESAKPQRMGFIDQNYLYTCGFNKSNFRELKLYDLRNFNQCIQTQTVDSQTANMMTFYDSDMGMIYVGGKGEGNIKFYEYSEGAIKFASEYRGTTQQKYLGAFPKRTMNYNKCEITRFAKLTSNTIEYLSFYVPKRNQGYDSSIYPECIVGEPCLTWDEWVGGANKEPVKKDITTLENKWNVESEMKFEKKAEVKVVKKDIEPEVQKQVSFNIDYRLLNVNF